MDYTKIEARILASMSLTDRTLITEATRLIEGANTLKERNEAKSTLYGLLYGNPKKLKDAITIPVNYGTEWNYAADYRKHGGYDGWGTNSE